MSLRVEHLRCDCREYPLNVDTCAPRLSWQLAGSERGQAQTAFRVLVALSPDVLEQDIGELWDSGVVKSDETVDIAYDGKAPASGARCFWKVMVWDIRGQHSAWSETASWEMAPDYVAGLDARWITLVAPLEDERSPLAGAEWIFPGAVDAADPDRMVCFRKTFDIPAGRRVTYALLHVAADGNFVSWIHGAKYQVIVNGQGDFDWAPQTTVRCPGMFQVGDALKPGRNTLALISAAGAGKAVALKCDIELDNGDTVGVVSDESWVCATSPQGARELPGPWLAPQCDDTGWPRAKHVARFGEGPWEESSPYRRIDKLAPPVCLRRRFSVAKPIAFARLHATAAGVYEVRVNGAAAGPDILAPGWTDYTRRILFQTFDVTRALTAGENVLSAVVADGWFSGNVGLWKDFQNLYGYEKGFLCRLDIVYADGSSETVISDSAWKAGTGPIRYSDLFMGEIRDRRREMPGWELPGYDDTGWRTAEVYAPEVGVLEPQSAPPVAVCDQITAVSVKSVRPGVYLADFGVNIVGRVRVRLHGLSGGHVRLRHGELLKKDGTLYTGNLLRALATDTCILNGDPEGELFEPSFTFHGFRYVEISGVSVAPGNEDIVAVVLRTALDTTGRFGCSDSLLNTLQENIVRTQQGNFLAIPTDCPQRSERVGWAGDAQVYSRTALFNADARKFFISWLDDLRNHQRADGAIADAVPSKEVGYGNFGWGDSIVVIPWNLYIAYGDRELLRRYYPAIKRWLAYLCSTHDGYLRDTKGWGDWLAPGPTAPNKIVATAYFAHAADLTARVAVALGCEDDAREYTRLFEKVRSVFVDTFVGPDGAIESDMQTAYALAIRFGLVQPSLVAKRFAQAVHRDNDRISAGFIGVTHVLPALTECGLTDLAYGMVLTREYPSWGCSIARGATTIWERWDGCDPDGPPEKRGELSSLNHYSFGAVGEWLYETLCGLKCDPTRPGWKRALIRPFPGGGITRAGCEYESVRGTFGCEWRVGVDGSFELDALVPAGATAEVWVPCGESDRVSESGVSALGSEGVRFVEMRDGHAVFEIGSGRYAFRAVPAQR